MRHQRPLLFARERRTAPPGTRSAGRTCRRTAGGRTHGRRSGWRPGTAGRRWRRTRRGSSRSPGPAARWGSRARRRRRARSPCRRGGTAMFSRIAVMLPSVMPEPKMICAHSGTALATSGWAVTSMASPTLDATMTTLRWSLKSTRDSVWMPTTATVANMASAAPPSTGCGMPATIAPAFGMQPDQDHDDPGGRDDVAALDPGQPDEADVLGEAGVREGVEDAADRGGQAVGAQCPRHVLAADPLVDDLAGREHVAGGLDGRDQHDDDHRDDRGGAELRPAEVERRGHAEPRRRRRPRRSARRPAPRRPAVPSTSPMSTATVAMKPRKIRWIEHDDGEGAQRVGEVPRVAGLRCRCRRRRRRARPPAAARGR